MKDPLLRAYKLFIFSDVSMALPALRPDLQIDAHIGQIITLTCI